MFPAGSVARTWKVWLPGGEPVYAFGLEQAEKAAPSRLHWNVVPLRVEPKLKLGGGEFARVVGRRVIVVSARSVSIVHV